MKREFALAIDRKDMPTISIEKEPGFYTSKKIPLYIRHASKANLTRFLKKS